VTRLSTGLTWYRFGMPAIYVMGAAVLANADPEIGPVLPFMLLGVVGYIIWFGWRLSEVWLDGDVLQVKGPGGSFRVPLADVLLLDTGRWGRGPRVFVLGLAHPVGRISKVRFVPAGSSSSGMSPVGDVEQDLQARIHAARTARKA
jgi:hypothetical protein